VTDAELAYRYPGPSVLRRVEAGSELLLATSGGVPEAGPALRPYFFSGPCKHVPAARIAARAEVR
jgi:hypothetical protein